MVWGTRNLRGQLQVPDNDLVADFLQDLGDPKASWNHFRDTLGNGQGVLGAIGELPGSSKIALGAVWGARNLRDRLQAPENELVACFFTDLGYRKPLQNRYRSDYFWSAFWEKNFT